MIFIILEQCLIECGNTKTKPITYHLDYSANLKPQQNQNQSDCLITFNTQ